MTKQEILNKLQEHGLIHHEAVENHGNCGNALCMKANAFVDDLIKTMNHCETCGGCHETFEHLRHR